jgi:hypothetical protein
MGETTTVQEVDISGAYFLRLRVEYRLPDGYVILTDAMLHPVGVSRRVTAATRRTVEVDQLLRVTHHRAGMRLQARELGGRIHGHDPQPPARVFDLDWLASTKHRASSDAVTAIADLHPYVRLECQTTTPGGS